MNVKQFIVVILGSILCIFLLLEPIKKTDWHESNNNIVYVYRVDWFATLGIIFALGVITLIIVIIYRDRGK